MTVPNIEFNGTEIVREVFEVPIMVNKEPKIVKMVEITSGKRREIIKKHVKTGINNQQVTGEVSDIMGLQVGILSEAITEAPFDTSEKGLNNLPENVVDYLYEQYQEKTKKKTLNNE